MKAMKPERLAVHLCAIGMLAMLLLSWSCQPMSPALADGTDDDILALAADHGLTDHDVHLGGSAALGASLYAGQVWARDLRYQRRVREGGAYPILSSLAACVAIGRAKEEYDRYDGGRVDAADLNANTSGCALGVATASIVDSETFTLAPEVEIDADDDGGEIDMDRVALTATWRW